HPRAWDDLSTLDRDAGIAISEFAPGAEVVKDKAVHTAVGVVDYIQLSDGGWIQHPDPLGPRSRAGVCHACLGISSHEGDCCPDCGSLPPRYATVDLAEPAGYRTSYRPRDYEQLSEPTAPSSQPRLATIDGDYLPRDGNALICSASG